MISQQTPQDQSLYQRAMLDELYKQAQLFAENNLIQTFSDAIPDFILVLNQHRQIVFCNKQLSKFVGYDEPQLLIGMRPGEVLHCINAHKTPFGCGTSEFCKMCGTNKSITQASAGVENIQECRIATISDLGSIDLRVKSTPIVIQNQIFTIFTMTDTSSEKRRQALERIFFHDLLNTAGSLLGYSEMMKDAVPEEIDMFRSTINQLAQNMCDEIQSQRQLTAAENHEIHIVPTVLHSRSLLENVAETYRHHPVCERKKIIITEDSDDFIFVTDEVLIRRVLGNLIKNALEASQQSESVCIGCSRADKKVEFFVSNNSVMPHDVQLQVFQRSFSTKGTGRGLGTYSVKLLTERYLKGKAIFESSEKTGTIFRITVPANVNDKVPKQGNIISFSPLRTQ